MRKIIIAGMVLLVMFFTACESKKNNVSGDSGRHVSNDSEIVPDVQYIRVGSGSGPRTPTSTVISSVNELNQYSGNFNRASSWNTEYTNVIAKYNNNYFANNFLVMVLLEESSGSNRHKVERVDRDGNIFIQRIEPEIGTADMATWNIIIELDNSFKLERFQVVIR